MTELAIVLNQSPYPHELAGRLTLNWTKNNKWKIAFPYPCEITESSDIK